MASAHKTVIRHNSLNCCDGFCIFGFDMITYDYKRSSDSCHKLLKLFLKVKNARDNAQNLVIQFI